MGEQAKKIGEKLENFGNLFFSDLGWEEMARDKEIKCLRSSHGKRTHGIDLLFNAQNSYLPARQGIILECKNRQMKSISQSEIEKWTKELIHTIECAQSAPELADVDLTGISLVTGLLVIHANDHFDKDKFYSYLQGISLSRRKFPINIFIAANDRIDEWTSICNKAKSYGDQFQWLYPSINNSSKLLTKTLTLNALFSKYILAKNVRYDDRVKSGTSYKEPHAQSIMVFRDSFSLSNFKYAWSMFKYFQLQGSDADEYIFSFYPRKNGDADYVNENFIKALKNGPEPISEEDAKKITIDFIDNRNLSPVETGGIR